jgi:peptide/nickel transport system permease protein
MVIWLGKRWLQAVGVVLVMTVLVFIGVNVIGDPTAILVPPEASPADRARLIASLHLDLPLWQQYLEFLRGVVGGHLGTSFVYNEPAARVILERMPATVELALSAYVISIVIGIPLGLFCGLKENHPVARGIMGISVLGFSIPTFWIGIMFIMIFAVDLGWLPSGGRGHTVSVLGLHLSVFTLDGLKHLLMPALTLSLFKIAFMIRLVKAGVKDVLPTPYIRFARAKGLSPARIVLVHLMKNLLIPVVTISGMELGTLIAFSVVTETVFGWPGMGKLIVDSINMLDRPLIVAYLMIMTVLFCVINMLVDISYILLDPRVRVNH